jgi:tRNA threonylcarbamoyladenosine modification (KEOPS) complex  Pcc1 subunit
VEKVTKPKPRERPVSRSRITMDCRSNRISI